MSGDIELDITENVIEVTVEDSGVTVEIGHTGPQGATGATGADGSSGATFLQVIKWGNE